VRWTAEELALLGRVSDEAVARRTDRTPNAVWQKRIPLGGAIADKHRNAGMPTREQFAADLESLSEVCRWTDGYWEFGPGAQRKWNEIHNTLKDIQLLANYLLVQFKMRVWSRHPAK
jgi:hypothetical protein